LSIILDWSLAPGGEPLSHRMSGKRKNEREDSPDGGWSAADIRALQEENAILRSLVDLSAEAIMIEAPGGRITFANQALCVACNGVVPTTLEQACRLGFGGGIQEPLAAACARAAQRHDLALEEVRSRGRHVVVASRSMSTGPAPLRLWVWTERADSPEVSSNTRHLQAIDLFATGIAHNFNNLLGGISGAVDALERIAGNDTRAQRCVGITRRCVDDAIALTRKMSGAHPPPRGMGSSAPLDDVVRDVLEVQETLHRGRITFETAIPSGLPPIDMGWDALARVIQNLVQNGVEAIKTVGWVTVTAKRGDKPGTVSVRIADNGVGMGAETLTRVYEPFFTTKNLDRANRVATDGSGLGLWNVYQAVQLVGGEIKIQSRVGEGTVVDLVLPAAKTVDPSPQHKA
jgi:signal transduction histidine kinase